MQQKHRKYKPFKFDLLENRTWPDKVIDKAPMWCSVDLRDGNQSLPIPMSIDEKLDFFKVLKNIGFKEIEIGFPSASETEYNFLRRLIEEGYITDDITVQVLVQAREHLIEKTYDALKGVKKAVVHFYNSTSVQQRRDVFKMSKEEIKEIAVNGAKLVKEYAKKYPETEFTFEYSPESFTGTEVDYAVDVCNAVIDVLEPTPDNKCILNLPATVEMSTPNIYADMIEYFCNSVDKRDSVIISLHTHNDRGTGVAASELGLMAGADRIEGTLFGNGERTGNVDIVTLAMNMFTQGIDPEIDLSKINDIIRAYETATRMTVHERHPYAGKLVYTAFSGSHQDAIRKGLAANKATDSLYWDVPYLPIDPADLNRQYEPIIRINSQSGKGGVAYILESSFGYKLPKPMHPYISAPVQKATDDLGKELSPNEILTIFNQEFIDIKTPLELIKFHMIYADNDDSNNVTVQAIILHNGEEKEISGQGNGPISAFFHGIQSEGFENYRLTDYAENSIDSGANAKAIACIQLTNGVNSTYGAGIDENTNKASIKAVISAINRLSK